jgi:hypothetical protein
MVTLAPPPPRSQARPLVDASATSLLLPPLFAGAVAIAVTLAVERWGGLLGGFLGTLPTTIVPAALGIAATSAGDEELRAALYAVPPGMLLSAGFLATWRVLPGWLPFRSSGARLFAMMSLSLGLWASGATLLVLVLSRSGSGLTSALLSLVLLVGGGLAATLCTPLSPPAARRVGVWVLLSRGLAAAVAIGVAVQLSAAGAGLAAGVAAVFPAIFVTTMAGLWWSHGEAVPTGAVGPMMIGSTSVASYAVVAAVTFPAFGLVAGSVLAWVLAAFVVQAPLFVLTRSLLSLR